jgi:glycine oxidase
VNTVIIAGAGIIGLSTALDLAEHGFRVTVLERGEPMREASWAAAGMLAVGDPENPPALRPLAEYSLRHYRDYVSRVEQLSGVHVPFRTSKTIQRGHGAEFTLDELSLDPRDLCRALPMACQAAGIGLHAHTAVTGVSHHNEVHTECGVWTAMNFVDCRGAWTGTPPLFSEKVRVAPRKGQMLSVMLPQGVALAHTLRTPAVYIVPRGDGRAIVGATVEDAGFDKAVDADAIRMLFERACALWPPLAAGRITDSWAGLRPSIPDALPILAAVGPHQFISTGHYRNGILLAPGSARVMRSFILGEEPEIDLTPYRADRFYVQSQNTDQDTDNDKQLTAAL